LYLFLGEIIVNILISKKLNVRKNEWNLHLFLFYSRWKRIDKWEIMNFTKKIQNPFLRTQPKTHNEGESYYEKNHNFEEKLVEKINNCKITYNKILI
jgi:hypothetical protein